MPKAKPKKEEASKAPPKPKYVTLYDVNNNPLQVPVDLVEDRLKEGYKREKDPPIPDELPESHRQDMS